MPAAPRLRRRSARDSSRRLASRQASTTAVLQSSARRRMSLAAARRLSRAADRAMNSATSVRVGRELAGSLEYLEDPTPGVDGMAAVRRGLLDAGIDTPLASNNAVTSFAELPDVLRVDAAQVILADHHYWGGCARPSTSAASARHSASASVCTPAATSASPCWR